MISFENAPPLVYKYRSWRDKFQKKVLTDREIYFASPRKLNDPCEFAVHPDHSQGTEEEVRAYHRKDIKRLNPDMTDEEVDKVLSNFPDGWWSDPYLFERHRLSTIELINTNFGVFSCSRIPDNELMWALYADGDRGFCVSFNTVKLLKHFVDLADSAVGMDDVSYYEKEPPKLNVYELGDNEALRQTTLIKSARWAFEKEIRLILVRDTNKSFPLNEETFSRVTLGSKMLPCHRDRIKHTLRGWQCRPQLFVREHVPNSFDFTTREISY